MPTAEFKRYRHMKILIILFLFTCIPNLNYAFENQIEVNDIAVDKASEEYSHSDADDFSPGLGIFALVCILSIFILVGVGAVLTVALLILITVLIGFGIMTSASIVAILNKKISSGVKTFVLLTTSLIAIAVGSSAGLLIKRFAELNISYKDAAISGSISGLLLGMLLSLSFNFIFNKISNIVKSRIKLKVSESKTAADGL